VTVSPARLSAALLALACALSAGGCAGTDAEEPLAANSSATATGSTTTGSATSPAVESQRIEVTVAGGEVTGDTGRVPVAAGTSVILVVTGDAADEIHVHGYDLTAQLEPGRPAELPFDATIPGVFEVELHEAGTVLLSLQVE
jgi:hypothetical protein